MDIESKVKSTLKELESPERINASEDFYQRLMFRINNENIEKRAHSAREWRFHKLLDGGLSAAVMAAALFVGMFIGIIAMEQRTASQPVQQADAIDALLSRYGMTATGTSSFFHTEDM